MIRKLCTILLLAAFVAPAWAQQTRGDKEGVVFLPRMTKEKIAFIVVRYGKDINGGAEYHCRMLAERLVNDYDVEVLTTCVKNYVTGDNEYPEGEEILNGVLVRRFYSDPVEPDLHKSYVRQAAPAKKWRHFLYRCRLLKPLSYVKPIWHYKEQEEIKALNSQVFYSSSMYAFIRENKASYRAFIPLSFFPHTYYTALYAPEKTILIPTMHNNGSSFRSIITSVFSEVAYIGFNIEAEQKLVENIVGKPLAAHGIISVGIVVEEKGKRNECSIRSFILSYKSIH